MYKRIVNKLPALASRRFASRGRLDALADEIAGLSLLESAELSGMLKTRLGIVDVAVAAAPVKVEEKVEEAPKPQKTVFALRLTGFDPLLKTKLIKEIKALKTELNLIQAKTLVESPPQLLKDDLSRDEADKLAALLTAVGAKLAIE